MADQRRVQGVKDLVAQITAQLGGDDQAQKGVITEIASSNDRLLNYVSAALEVVNNIARDLPRPLPDLAALLSDDEAAPTDTERQIDAALITIMEHRNDQQATAFKDAVIGVMASPDRQLFVLRTGYLVHELLLTASELVGTGLEQMVQFLGQFVAESEVG
jgi:hypothetical protein